MDLFPQVWIIFHIFYLIMSYFFHLGFFSKAIYGCVGGGVCKTSPNDSKKYSAGQLHWRWRFLFVRKSYIFKINMQI